MSGNGKEQAGRESKAAARGFNRDPSSNTNQSTAAGDHRPAESRFSASLGKFGFKAFFAALTITFLLVTFLPSDSIPWLTLHSKADQPPASSAAQPPERGAQPSEEGAGETFFTRIFGEDPSPEQRSETWPERIGRISVRLLLAALLSAALAFRPRPRVQAVQRNPYVAQTEMLIAVVGSALMMIVADNAARAFGIFAAASLVRFRTNIRDPKETTVLLVSLGIGLATGVGRWELAIIFSIFVLLLLWILEYYEPAQVVRTMELKLKTRNVEVTDEILKEIFEKQHVTAEVREINREDEEDPLGKIVYYVGLNPSVSVDRLSDEIFSADPDNIDSIEWDQKRSLSYIYR